MVGLGDLGVLFDCVIETVSRVFIWYRGDVLWVVIDFVALLAFMVGEWWVVLVEEVVDGYFGVRCVSFDFLIAWGVIAVWGVDG